MSDWTPDEFAALDRFCGGDPRTPQTITVEVFDMGYGDDCAASEFLQKVADAIASIPEQHRTDAKVELHGEYSCRLNIRYDRQENADEIASRIARDMQYVRREAERERAVYERLKTKFG